MKAPEDIEKYAVHYDDLKMPGKIKKAARNAGIKVLYYVLVLYYALKGKNISAKDRALVYGALGYFLLPIDILPDVIPFCGYADDYAALAFVIFKVAKSITPQTKEMAKARLRELFGDYDESEIDDQTADS